MGDARQQPGRRGGEGVVADARAVERRERDDRLLAVATGERHRLVDRAVGAHELAGHLDVESVEWRTLVAPADKSFRPAYDVVEPRDLVMGVDHRAIAFCKAEGGDV